MKFGKYWLIKVGERSEPRKIWKNCVFNHKILADSDIRTFALPKSVGGGGHKPTCGPPLLKVGRHDPPPAPFSYALDICHEPFCPSCIKKRKHKKTVCYMIPKTIYMVKLCTCKSDHCGIKSLCACFSPIDHRHHAVVVLLDIGLSCPYKSLVLYLLLKPRWRICFGNMILYIFKFIHDQVYCDPKWEFWKIRNMQILMFTYK